MSRASPERQTPRPRRRLVAGTLLVCGTVLACGLPALFRPAARPAPSVVGTWETGPPVPKWDTASLFPAGQPSRRLVLDRDGTGRYVFSNVGSLPLTWEAHGSTVVLNEPRGYPERGTISADGRSLTITSAIRLPNVRDTWRFVFLGKPLATTATRWERKASKSPPPGASALPLPAGREGSLTQ